MNLKVKIISSVLVGLFLLATFITIAAVSQANKSLEQKAINQLDSIKTSKATHVKDYFETLSQVIKSYGDSGGTVTALNELGYAFENIGDTVAFEKDIIEKKLKEDYEKNYLSSINTNLPSIKPVDEVSKYLPKSVNGLIAQKVMIVDNPNKIGEKNNLIEHPLHDGLYLDAHITHHPGFNNLLKNFDLYDVFLVNKKGDVVYTVFKEKDYGTNLINGVYKDSALGSSYKRAMEANKGDVIFEDFKPYEPSYNDFAAFLATPILDADQKIGAIIFQISSKKLDKIISFNGKYERAGLGKSGEVLLVDSNFILKNNSRFVNKIEQKYVKENKQTLGIFKVQNSLIKDALNGKDGVGYTKNYLNEKVISTYAPLKVFDQNWAIVAQMSEDEALEDAISLRNLIIVISLITLILVTAVLYLIINKQLIKPLDTFQNGLQNFFSYLNKETSNASLVAIDSKDEIGIMAKVVNENIEKIRVLIDDDNKIYR